MKLFKTGSLENKTTENIPDTSGKHTTAHIVLSVVFSILIVIFCVLYSASIWYANVFGAVGFNSILFTLTNDVGAANSDLIQGFMLKSILPALGVGILLSLLLWVRLRKEKPNDPKKPSKAYLIRDRISTVISIAIIIMLIGFTVKIVGFDTWVKNFLTTSDLFEKEYVDPKNQVSFSDKQRNLIVIYLESMETTFFDQDKGGGLDHNVIPELYDLAKHNVNFSDNYDVGGFLPIEGTGWTIGAMVASSSGVPLVTYGEDGNLMGENTSFLKGLTTINDLLHENGYNQALMVGSDSNFGGRKKYFTEHGVDKVYDYYTAIEDQIIPEDYYVWWGMEDQYLYEYAKQELPKLAQQNKPFNFTMLTVDTHHVDGYVCDLCQNEYEEQYENVYACAGRQLYGFVEWLKQQPFYEDTTIVIIGDHTSMDEAYINRQVGNAYRRHVYNCFINAVPKAKNTKNRFFTTVDIFPTTLAAMGCTISGDRLGLGVNMFSGLQTLAEKYGFDNLNSMAAQRSAYFDEHFSFK